jgi:hypothetical protein
MSDKRKLYGDLYNAYKLAYPNKTAQSVQSDTNTFWNSVKAKDDVYDLVQKKLCDLGNVKRKNAGNLLSFWSQVKIVKKTMFNYFGVLKLQEACLCQRKDL